MSNVIQPSLLGPPPPPPPAPPAAALSNPAAQTVGQMHKAPQPTEKKAAYDVMPRTGTQRMKVLTAIANAPDGLTDAELAERTGLYLYSAAPRRNELLQGGWVIDSGQRRDTGHGGSAIVWVLSIAGRARWTQQNP